MTEIFLDTETTGLSANDGDRIVEIACVETKDLIPTNRVFHKLINPQKKVHVLVIPKGEYVDFDDFNNKATDKEIVEFNKAVTHVAHLLGTKGKGYRTLTNIDNDGGQEVPHLHFHIFAGEKIGKMVS